MKEDKKLLMVLKVKYLQREKQPKVQVFKILTPKQVFQRLHIELTQVKANNTSENSLNETRQVIYSLY